MASITAEEVRRAVDGDRAALEGILRALERPFFNLALRMMLPSHDVEDAAQECLVRVATRLAQFDGSARFSTWAWRVAVHRILDYRDGAARSRLRLEVFDSLSIRTHESSRRRRAGSSLRRVSSPPGRSTACARRHALEVARNGLARQPACFRRLSKLRTA